MHVLEYLHRNVKTVAMPSAMVAGALLCRPVTALEAWTHQMITPSLIFLIYALDDEKLESGAGPRFSAFVEETNELLMEADMMELYPVNPYEAFILMCVVSEELIDTFALVWKKSYEE